MQPMRVEISVPEPPFMGYKEAAAYVGVSPDLLSRSDMPRCELGGRTVFFVADLVHYTLARRKPPLDKDTVIEIKVIPRVEAQAA